MRILFCNIAWMNYYKGIVKDIDEPKGGGSFVKDTKDAHEKYNFEAVPVHFEDGFLPDDAYCLGFVMTKFIKSEFAQLKIERIAGCELCRNEEYADDVLVVYCAKHPAHNFTTVVGWYKHAVVFREFQKMEFQAEEEEDVYVQFYNAIAKKEDCVLLPISARSRVTQWKVPRTQGGASYGFGQANVWFAEGENENHYLKEFIRKIVKQIEEYEGENWIDRYPEDN